MAAAIESAGIPPTNDKEAAILRTISGKTAGYTAIVRGANGTVGVALVEVYQLNPN